MPDETPRKDPYCDKPPQVMSRITRPHRLARWCLRRGPVPEPDYSIWGDICDYYRFGDLRRVQRDEVLHRKRLYAGTYILLTVAVLVLSAALPFFAGEKRLSSPWVLGATGLAIAVCSGVLLRFGLNRQWVLLRETELVYTAAINAWELRMLDIRSRLEGPEARQEAHTVTVWLFETVTKKEAQTFRDILSVLGPPVAREPIPEAGQGADGDIPEPNGNGRHEPNGGAEGEHFEGPHDLPPV